MNKFFIFGAGGFAREVEFALSDNFENNIEIVFVLQDVGSNIVNEKINGRKVISEDEFHKIEGPKKCFIAVGSPDVKQKIFNNLKDKKGILFPNFIHKSAVLDNRFISLGKGNIICSNVSLTTNIQICNFVHINLNCTVGHDTIIKDFVTLSPSCNISGNVIIDELSYLGTNCIVIEKRKIASKVVIGAGCLVVKDIQEQGTYVGVPAKKIK